MATATGSVESGMATATCSVGSGMATATSTVEIVGVDSSSNSRNAKFTFEVDRSFRILQQKKRKKDNTVT